MSRHESSSSNGGLSSLRQYGEDDSSAHRAAPNSPHSRALSNSPYPRANLSSPHNRTFLGSPYSRAPDACSSPYRSPAHAAAVSAVEQQLHSSLHQTAGLFEPGNFAPHSPTLQQQAPHGLLADGSYHPQTDYGRPATQHIESGSLLRPLSQHVPGKLQVDSGSLLSPLSQHKPRTELQSDSGSLLSPLNHMHLSPQLDSLSQRLREQKLSTAKQGQNGNSPLLDNSAFSTAKAYAIHSSSRPPVHQLHRQESSRGLATQRSATVLGCKDRKAAQESVS